MANENEKTVVNNEEAFKKWMKGRKYRSSTCSAYAKVINEMSEKFLQGISPYRNIFNIGDVRDFRKARTLIINHPEFAEYNVPPEEDEKTKKKGGGHLPEAPIDALARYEEFLQEKSGPLPCDFFRSRGKEYSSVDAVAETFYQKFRDGGIYYWKTLKNLSGQDILDNIFLPGNKKEDNGSLYHALTCNGNDDMFGDISMSQPSSYGVFYIKKDGKWKTALERENGKPKSVSTEEAIEAGGKIRNDLVDGARIIEGWKNSLNTIEDYRKMFKELEDKIHDYIRRPWVLKYYHMSFPGVFPTYYRKEEQDHILCSLLIRPDADGLVKMAQIALYGRECGISNVMFAKIAEDAFGKPKTFHRIGTGEGKKSFFNEWHEGKYVAIGWKDLGNLNTFYQKGSSDAEIRKKILARLTEKYGEKGSSAAFTAIDKFYKASAGSYVVAMKGSLICGIGEITGGYEYKEGKEYAHCRPVKWEWAFDEEEGMPIMTGVRRNFTFGDISKTENIFQLYLMLHGEGEPPTDVNLPRNLIFFGAPGTGKSHDLNVQKNDLLGDNREGYERVTFHPDYSYAHFVGTYKPVVPDDGPNRGEITYEYIPGPFMRVYVKAKKDPGKRFLLIIEEINRANVAAVFGDVFQLLDRAKDGGSEYPVAASEDMKGYLKANGIGDCDKIAIPPNMYIWATMNSADQGVFPMDTAFKRRWDFKYLDIDHNAEVMDKYDVPVPYGDTDKFMKWNVLRTEINNLLADEDINVNEDKQLGPFFINMEIIKNARSNPKAFKETFENKVLMYLFEDAARHRRDKLFGSKTIRYSEICEAYEKNGLGVFVKLKAKYGKNANKPADDSGNKDNQESAGTVAAEGENDQ